MKWIIFFFVAAAVLELIGIMLIHTVDNLSKFYPTLLLICAMLCVAQGGLLLAKKVRNDRQF
jgi:hypothetical protein